MSSFDVAQTTTLFFGGAVVVMVLLAYNNQPDTTDPDALDKGSVRIYTVASNALPFFFVAYTTLIASAATGKTAEMYKNFVLLVGIGSIVHAWAVKPTPDEKGWGKVANDVTSKLAAGAFFALPIALYTM